MTDQRLNPQPRRAGAVLFVKDLEKVTAFYREVFQLHVMESSEDYVVLACGGMDLTLHSLPAPIARQITIASPPERRGMSPYKLSFPVESITKAREQAAITGGMFDPAPPAWVIEEQKICLGHDPEGNVVEARMG